MTTQTFQFRPTGPTYYLSESGLQYCLYGNQTTYLDATSQDIHRFIAQLLEQWSQNPVSFKTSLEEAAYWLAPLHLNLCYSSHTEQGIHFEHVHFQIDGHLRLYELQTNEMGSILYKGCVIA